MTKVGLIGYILVLAANQAFSQSWTIGNDQISRTLTFEPSRGLYTEGLSDLATHTDLIRVAKAQTSIPAEFSFQCEGKTYRGASSAFKLVSASQDAIPNGKSL